MFCTRCVKFICEHIRLVFFQTVNTTDSVAALGHAEVECTITGSASASRTCEQSYCIVSLTTGLSFSYLVLLVD